MQGGVSRGAIVDHVAKRETRIGKSATSTKTTAAGSNSSLRSSTSVLKSSSLAGLSISVLKTLFKHPLDTLTVQIQTNPSNSKLSTLDFSPPSLYSGVLPSLTSSVLTGPIFFAAKDASLSYLPPSLNPTLRVALAVALATPIYWSARTPLETLKSRSQSSPETPLLNLPRNNLFSGYLPNVLYGYPADILKFVIYDVLKNSLMSTYVSGAVSTMIAQAVTTPLDVKRNRVMCSEDGVGVVEEGDRWKGLGLRVGKAAVSGAVQFGVYEYVVGKF
ncbi:hypothetical protein TrST_g8136 [Triparma strigata]|uniref:Uncharacterized protein n=1 Tax=Triparma strigata TaxID=1606541 RepID=A0A9W7F4I3_9STRA|nr:hypothetical protein TrST_g8136 [Triparma strigata]